MKIGLKQEVLARTIPPTFLTLFNKLNTSKRCDIAQNSAEWFSFCLSTTSKFRTIILLRNFAKQRLMNYHHSAKY
jgi:hypothetical protein